MTTTVYRLLWTTLIALAVALPAPRIAPLPPPAADTLRWRAGVGVSHANPIQYPWPVARPGWFLNWDVDLFTAAGAYTQRQLPAGAELALGMTYVPLIRTLGGEVAIGEAEITAAARRAPGLAWIVGNEPDIRAQDWAMPAAYARAYHRIYTALKAGDPTAQVVAGNLSQVTPLRLRYLDAVRAAYQIQYGVEMPVDVWGVHLYILPESADGWGAGLPPGQEAYAAEGTAWSVDDHDSLVLLADQVRALRAWMAAHGARDTPLWVTEYGILMPPELGFAPPRVAAFLQGSMDWFYTARDPALGLAADDDRLVQRWAWFSAHNVTYPTGNLFDAAGRPTPILDAYVAFLTRQD